MSDPTSVVPSVDAPIYLEDFERHKDRVRAIPTGKLLTINVDPLFAVQMVQKALPRLKALRARMIEEFTRFDPSDLDNLQGYGHCFVYTTMLLRATEPQVSGFDPLLEECSDTLGRLEAYLRAAIAADIITSSRLSELKGGVGHRNLVHDLLLVVQIYRSNWSKIEGKTFFTQADIRHADALAARLNATLAERDVKPGSLDEVTLDRQRAFTLFYRAYENVRRCVWFLLKSDDEEHLLEEVMPSLHNNSRGGRKRPEETSPEPAPVTAAPAAPAQGTAPQPPINGGRVGMPDSNPFTS